MEMVASNTKRHVQSNTFSSAFHYMELSYREKKTNKEVANNANDTFAVCYIAPIFFSREIVTYKETMGIDENLLG